MDKMIPSEFEKIVQKLAELTDEAEIDEIVCNIISGSYGDGYNDGYSEGFNEGLEEGSASDRW